MKTLSGTELLPSHRGVVYLCEYTRGSEGKDSKLEVTFEITTFSASDAMIYYAEIPNPASQVATGNTYSELCKELTKLHERMQDQEWINDLKNYL